MANYTRSVKLFALAKKNKTGRFQKDRQYALWENGTLFIFVMISYQEKNYRTRYCTGYHVAKSSWQK